MPRLSFAALAHPRRGNAWLVASALLALGVVAAEVVNPSLLTHPPSWAGRLSTYGQPHRDSYSLTVLPTPVYAASVVRIIDGDTFVARVRVRPGNDVETHVRLRDIDAAELHARCRKELRLALAARTALERLLADGRVTLSRVGRDKYPGRIDATVATRDTADVSAAMLRGGYARPYDGGRRGSWCW
jgi:endonuclease YncB( thermonuclease family)